MSRLPTLTPRQVVTALLRTGFEELSQTGSHLHLRHPVTKHRTLVAIHARDLKRGALTRIIKQAGLTEEEFRNLL